MGLDMYVFTTTQDIPAVDFTDAENIEKLYYWRKHPDLHGWMEELYRSKGGEEENFNLVAVRLDPSDLDLLEKTVVEDALPATLGFFFGQSRPENKDRDLEFIKIAREALADGKFVFYWSWW